MQTRQVPVYEAIAGAVHFLKNHGHTLGPIITESARRNVVACHERLAEAIKAQNEYTRLVISTMAVKRTVRDRLVNVHMRAVATVARAKMSKNEEWAALTSGSRRDSYTNLVALGHGMAREAKKHKDTLIQAGGLPDDFIEQLEAAADALTRAISDHGLALAARGSARNTIYRECREARVQIRLIDIALRGALPPDDVRLAQWASQSHIRRLPGFSDAPAASTESTPAPTNESSPAPVADIRGPAAPVGRFRALRFLDRSETESAAR